jgi:predicted HicB family RNase H-like nuclease
VTAGDAMMYRGYAARYEVDDEDGVLHGHLAGIRDVVTFESETLEGLEREFRTSVDVYLDWCAERGIAPNLPRAEPRRAVS